MLYYNILNSYSFTKDDFSKEINQQSCQFDNKLYVYLFNFTSV